MTYFEAYLLTRLDGIHMLLNVMIVLIWFASAYLLMQLANSRIDRLFNKVREWDLTKKQNSLLRHLKFVALIFIILVVVKALTPTTKEMSFIYLASNQDVQEALKKLPAISNFGLEYLSDIMKKEIEDKVKEY